MFVGRKTELEFLEEKYKAPEGQLVVLYGRRRVGKTETIRKFCENKPTIFYTCVECPDEQQLKNFSNKVLKTGIPAAKYIHTFTEWEQAFRSITEIESAQRIVVVIDEFPYMVKANSSIPSVLQKLWDEVLQHKNVMFVLCGSSMSFIEKEILSEKNPLYGRATGILKMNAMSFYEAIQFVPNYSIEDQIKTYAVLGGIPHYLKQFDDTITLEENIKKHILTRGSVLYSEVEFLLRQELREISVYNIIIEAIALGNTRLNDIYLKTQIEKTKLSAYLKNLMDLKIIYREFSVDEGIKEQANVQRGLYRVTDNYFRFWYAFVFPNISELEAGDSSGVYEHIVKKELHNYTSYVFEEICKEYLRKKNMQNELPFYFSKIGRWWNKTDEIDIMAVDYQRQNYILGECKYKNTVFTLADFKNLQRKVPPALAEKNIFYWVFSKGGCTNEVLDVRENENVACIALEDLIYEK